ncbi:MAG: hypothetical protein DRR19_18610, partial [Candidatus Parabeggiatoa sp. nov. 1]
MILLSLFCFSLVFCDSEISELTATVSSTETNETEINPVDATSSKKNNGLENHTLSPETTVSSGVNADEKGSEPTVTVSSTETNETEINPVGATSLKKNNALENNNFSPETTVSSGVNADEKGYEPTATVSSTETNETEINPVDATSLKNNAVENHTLSPETTVSSGVNA